jgi:hypothetical protein
MIKILEYIYNSFDINTVFLLIILFFALMCAKIAKIWAKYQESSKQADSK